jgi:hypothetical protein
MFSNAVLKEQFPVQPHHRGLTLIEGGRSAAATHRKTTDMLLIGALLIVLQVLDGVLTATGVGAYGLQAEGNPMLRGLMQLLGAIPALIITKTVCIALIVMLCKQAHSIRWLPLALKGVAGIYTIMAVLPWTLILAHEYLL